MREVNEKKKKKEDNFSNKKKYMLFKLSNQKNWAFDLSRESTDSNDCTGV